MTRRKRKALGRGMDEIFPGIGQEEGATPSEIDIDLIEPNPYQPRKEWKAEDIESLAESIRNQGILQPLVVRKKGGRFQLIAGERRLRAAMEAGLSTVPVVIRQADDQQMLALALVENIQRRDLGPIEKAEAFRRLSDEFDLTQEEMGRKVGMDRSSVANFQRLLDLPEKVIDLLRRGDLAMGHGRALLGLKDSDTITRFAVNAVKRRLSVRDLEKRIRQLTASGSKKRSTISGGTSPETRQLQESLQRLLKTKVRIKGSGGKGRIEISYHSLDELDRILEMIRKAESQGN
ncbi:MAG: ParB/RepB/Spo0J family partition protein [Candidatus Aegiribacteria sp.]|nr:ParB/RepB/Spo0J family partition protein [Candidatus Aegiribacteria sp.]MBD3294833.1 ParB/RepB/Spo0J family partition protein [Candidatus Fermentibacteria bacterium]